MDVITTTPLIKRKYIKKVKLITMQSGVDMVMADSNIQFPIKRKYTKKVKADTIQSDAPTVTGVNLNTDTNTDTATRICTRPLPVTFNNKVWYRAEELYAFDKIYFYGCCRMQTIVEKKNLQTDDYMFAYMKDNTWIICNKDYKRSKFLIREELFINKLLRGILFLIFILFDR